MKFGKDVESGYYVAIPIYVGGTLTTGVKKAEFIAPVAMTVTKMMGRCDSGANAQYRPSKNGGSTDGTQSAVTGTSVVTTTQNVALAVGDRLTINVTAAGTGVDLSVTLWARVG